MTCYSQCPCETSGNKNGHLQWPRTSFSERAKVQERQTRKMRRVSPIRDGRLIKPKRNMNGIRVFTPLRLIVRRIKRRYVSYSVLDDLNNGVDLVT